MRAVLTISDVTRMQGARVCVAGYLPDDTCVRPLLRVGGLTETWLFVGRQVAVQPFARVELDLLEHRPEPPHTEDWIIAPTYRRRLGLLDMNERAAFLERIGDGALAEIFGTPIHQDEGTYVLAGAGRRSLGTIAVERVADVTYSPRPMGKWDYRLAFTDLAGQRYRLAVTDLAFRYLLDRWRLHDGLEPSAAARRLTSGLRAAQVFLRVGLARGWERHPDRCYVQITGVYSFPDYLEGRCFADLDPMAYSADDVPF